VVAALLLAALAAAPELGAEPRLVRSAPPELPAGTVFPAPEVTVVLAIDVSATGAVEAVRLEEGVGEPFDSAAIAAAGRYAFEPARLTTGEAVPVTVHFRLRIEAPRPPVAAPPPVRLAGRLLERGTRRPLAGVEVAAREGDRALATATTDEDGRFALAIPEPAGRFDFDRGSGPDARVKLEDEAIAPGTGAAQIWAVARDGRGGQSVVGPFEVGLPR
jgi:TonB family protein